jgi:hypothetical protein
MIVSYNVLRCRLQCGLVEIYERFATPFAWTSETSASFYQTARYHILDTSGVLSRLHEYLKYT